MNTGIAGLAVFLTAGIVAGAAAAPPVDSEFRAKLRWQPAPTVTIAVDRAYLLSGPPLEQIAAEGRKPPAKTAEEPAEKSRAVVEGELIPLRYRRTINRYFFLIRRSAQP